MSGEYVLHEREQGIGLGYEQQLTMLFAVGNNRRQYEAY